MALSRDLLTKFIDLAIYGNQKYKKRLFVINEMVKKQLLNGTGLFPLLLFNIKEINFLRREEEERRIIEKEVKNIKDPLYSHRRQLLRQFWEDKDWFL